MVNGFPGAITPIPPLAPPVGNAGFAGAVLVNGLPGATTPIPPLAPPVGNAGFAGAAGVGLAGAVLCPVLGRPAALAGARAGTKV